RQFRADGIRRPRRDPGNRRRRAFQRRGIRRVAQARAQRHWRACGASKGSCSRVIVCTKVMKIRSGSELVVASHNPGKGREIRELREPFGVASLGAAELGLDEPEETGTTFADNAILKARAAAAASGRIALADDSGLSVDALEGAPGIFSARWAGPNKDFR